MAISKRIILYLVITAFLRNHRSFAKHARYWCSRSRGLRKLPDKPWFTGPVVVRTSFSRELLPETSAPRGTGIPHVRVNAHHGQGQSTRMATSYPAVAETAFREDDPCAECHHPTDDSSLLYRANYGRRRVLARAMRPSRFHAPATPILIGHLLIEDEDFCRPHGYRF